MQRKVIRLMGGANASPTASILSSLAEDCRKLLAARVTYVMLYAADGALNCVATSPRDAAPLGRHAPDEASTHVVSDASPLPVITEPWRHLPALPGEVVACVPIMCGDRVTGAVCSLLAESPGSEALRIAGALGAHAGRALDLTEANARLGAELEVSRRLSSALESAFSRTGDALAVIDMDGRVLRWNDPCEDLHGWPASEVLGQVLPMVEPRRRKVALANIRAAAARGTYEERSVIHITRAGDFLPVTIAVIPLPDVCGSATAVACVIRPAEPIRFAHPLEALADTAVGRLAGPVTAISGFAQLLQREAVVSDTGSRKRVAHGLATRCKEVEAALEELRLVQRLVGGAASLDFAAVDLVEAATRAADRVLPKRRLDTEAGPPQAFARADVAATQVTIEGMMRALDTWHAPGEPLRLDAERSGTSAAITLGVRKESDRADRLDREFGIHLARLYAQAHGGRFDLVQSGMLTEARLVMPAAKETR